MGEGPGRGSAPAAMGAGFWEGAGPGEGVARGAGPGEGGAGGVRC